MNNNKGFSLIELLVAIGVSGVVILMISFIMVQGTTLFKGENEVIDIQGEIQIVRNQITEALMGAKSVVVVEAEDGVVIYTGEVDKESNRLKAETSGPSDTNVVTTERIITYVKATKSLYISSTKQDAVSEGSLVSNYVTDMKVVFKDDNAQKFDKGGVDYYRNPFSVNVSLTLEHGEQQSDLNIDVRVRNILTQVSKYEATQISKVLKDATKESIYKVR